MPTRLLLLALLSPLHVVAALPVIEHRVELTLDPAAGTVRVVDRITLPAALRVGGRALLRLNPALFPVEVEGASASAGASGELRLALDGDGALTLRYGGRLRLERTGVGEWFDAEGAHLGAGSGWYARADASLLSFDLTVHAPPGWRALAPGRALPADAIAGRWVSERPVDTLDVVAGPYREYRRDEPWGEARVWLREADDALARTYLDATARYLPMYSRLLGSYPYAKFAVVENVRPSGWGMPSFTLLGAGVMRLPFIPHTSLPHEIAHNWWGNGVLVDLREGNWSEGLTAYLADHLLAQDRGDGVRHRRDALARFRDAAGGEAALAPVRFVARHDRASQAAGYDRPMMIFHMLRRAGGDAAFVAGLRELYARRLSSPVGAREVLAALAPRGEDWFTGWWLRADAPELALHCCEVTALGSGERVSGVIRQVQPGPPFDLRVPVQVLADGESRAREVIVRSNSRETAFSLDVPARAAIVALDAAFDLMRVPAAGELPPALGELLGARGALAVLAPGLPSGLASAYRQLAAAVGAEVVDPARARNARVLWVLGAGAARGAVLEEALARTVERGDTRVLVSRDDDGRVTALVVAASAAAAQTLARRLPHYGRYGALGFEGDEARNVLRRGLEASASPLRVALDPAWTGRAIPLGEERALAAP